MRLNNFVLFACLIVLVIFVPLALTSASEPITHLTSLDVPPGKVYVYKHSAGRPRQMEIYFPPGHDTTTAKVPGLILFHGGGWSGGSLKQFQTACHYFASRGIVCATVEYQMLGKAARPNLPEGVTKKRVCIIDAKSAIRWFKNHADELGIDRDRIITGGGSAGGHISALATLNPGLNDPADPSNIDTSVVAYLRFNPAFSPDDSRDKEVDVHRFINPAIAPAIVFFGTTDSWKPGWDAAQKTLKSVGNETTEVFLANGQPHGFFNNEPWRTQTLIEADRFLVRHGLLSGEPTLITPADTEQLIQSQD